MARLGEPPVDYLRECSSTSLRYFEMSKLEHVANLRRELSVLLEEMMEESALALFARWMIEKRTAPGTSAGPRGSGNEEKTRVSRRARRLLADFVSASARSLEAQSASEGPGQKSRPGDLGAAGQSGGDALDWRELIPPPKEPVASARANGRSEKRPERKSSRPARA